MRNNIKEIEKKLQAFFEEQLQRLSGSDPLKLATREVLTSQMDQIVEKNKKRFSPNIFRLTFKRKNSIDDKDLEPWKSFLTEMIKETARENSLSFSGPVHVQHFFDPSLPQEVSVEVAFSSISTRKTTDLIVGTDKKELSGKRIKGYLITPDESIFPLSKKINNIGRGDDNDLVIDNLRVSRVHAQVREINGSHVLFDLDSTVGTKVNNQRISQHTLANGDVIEIADVAFVYGTDPEIDEKIHKRFQTRVISIKERDQ
jgi:hypothetical protein